jgi:hypothetical protein
MNIVKIKERYDQLQKTKTDTYEKCVERGHTVHSWTEIGSSDMLHVEYCVECDLRGDPEANSCVVPAGTGDNITEAIEANKK